MRLETTSQSHKGFNKGSWPKYILGVFIYVALEKALSNFIRTHFGRR